MPPSALAATRHALAPFQLPPAPADGSGIHLQGSLTDARAEALVRDHAYAGAVVTVADGTRVFLEPATQRKLLAAGIDLRQRRPVPLLALCGNPTAPRGQPVDATALLQGLHGCFPDLPVVDVVREELSWAHA